MSFVSLSIYPIFNKQVLLCPFYKCRNWGSERFVNRSEVTQLPTLNLDLIQIQISPTLKLKFLAIIHSGHRQRRKYYFHLSLPPPSFLPASLLKKEVGGGNRSWGLDRRYSGATSWGYLAILLSWGRAILIRRDYLVSFWMRKSCRTISIRGLFDIRTSFVYFSLHLLCWQMCSCKDREKKQPNNLSWEYLPSWPS